MCRVECSKQLFLDPLKSRNESSGRASDVQLQLIKEVALAILSFSIYSLSSGNDVVVSVDADVHNRQSSGHSQASYSCDGHCVTVWVSYLRGKRKGRRTSYKIWFQSQKSSYQWIKRSFNHQDRACPATKIFHSKIMRAPGSIDLAPKVLSSFVTLSKIFDTSKKNFCHFDIGMRTVVVGTSFYPTIDCYQPRSLWTLCWFLA